MVRYDRLPIIGYGFALWNEICLGSPASPLNICVYNDKSRYEFVTMCHFYVSDQLFL